MRRAISLNLFKDSANITENVQNERYERKLKTKEREEGERESESESSHPELHMQLD